MVIRDEYFYLVCFSHLTFSKSELDLCLMGTVTTTSVPDFGRTLISNLPPFRCARSRMLVNPYPPWLEGLPGLYPVPSSRTLSSRLLLLKFKSISTLLGF